MVCQKKYERGLFFSGLDIFSSKKIQILETSAESQNTVQNYNFFAVSAKFGISTNDLERHGAIFWKVAYVFIR